MNNTYPNPQEYVRSGSYNSLVLADDTRLGGLEKEVGKVVVGYVKSATESKLEDISPQAGVPYAVVHELIFEYLKYTNNGGKITDFITRMIGRLEEQKRVLARPPRTRDTKVDDLLERFRKLKQKRIRDINYLEFQPHEYNAILLVFNPFKTFCNQKIIGRLVNSDVLENYQEGHSWYLRLSPEAQISRA